MTANILADTSAWIESFRKTGNDALQDFMRQALAEDSLMTCPVVILELLQGCKGDKEFEKLKSFLEILPSCDFGSNTWMTAYEIGFVLRRRGLTLPTVDIMLAALAKSHGFTLLHHDRHFEQMQTFVLFPTITFL